MSDSRSNSESTKNSNSTIGDCPAVKDTLGFLPYVIAIKDYPKGKFGFSIQKEIYESLGGQKSTISVG